MKYIQNNGRYALAFEIVKDNRNVKIAFDRKRVFQDTGNIATTGITAVEDDDFEELCKLKRFNKLFETKEFELTDVTKIKTAETKVKELEDANKKLEKELEKAKKKNTPAEVKKQLEDKDNEINDLKAKLEALTKAKEDSADEVKDSEGKKDETEGF